MSEWTRDKANEVINKIAEKACTDAEFRQLALTDPVAAVGTVDSTPMPDGFTLRFVDNAGADLSIILPDPVSAEDELSDSDLEQVAGGVGDNNRCGGSCVVSCGISSVL